MHVEQPRQGWKSSQTGITKRAGVASLSDARNKAGGPLCRTPVKQRNAGARISSPPRARPIAAPRGTSHGQGRGVSWVTGAADPRSDNRITAGSSDFAQAVAAAPCIFRAANGYSSPGEKG